MNDRWRSILKAKYGRRGYAKDYVCALDRPFEGMRFFRVPQHRISWYEEVYGDAFKVLTRDKNGEYVWA